MTSASAKRRSPGRPAANDGGDSAGQRTRLLDAALARFVRDGMTATTARGIAEEAGVTPALLNYYFGGRDALQQAVVEERLMPVLRHVGAQLALAGDDPATLIASFTSAIGEAVAEYPWLPTLWLREVLLDGGALREVFLRHGADMLPRALAQRFVAAQKSGRLNPELDPRLLVVSLVGLTLFPAAAAPIWRQVFAADDIDMTSLQEHTWRLLHDGLRLEDAE
ncbi:MAG: TetR/AcrR family transcriptional regulator [Xanthomonadales bacterium]|nr:TetR/AcrR family transcriptional regulator [Xanthomonadales bacterium]